MPTRLLLTLAGLALAGTAAAAESVGVLAVAGAPGPDEALMMLTAALRPALASRLPGLLSAAELRNVMTGEALADPVETLDADYQAALALHAGGDFEGSIRSLRGLLGRLERLPGGDAVHSRWTRVMLRVARSEQAVGRRSEAQVLLERLLRIDPEVVVDPRLYPPGFQRLVEEVRADVGALSRLRLTVASARGAQIFLERRPVGEAPVSLDLPPGRYRLSAASGLVRSREVVVDLATDDRSVQIDLSLAEVLRPDGGPGLAISTADRSGKVAAAGAWLGLDRVVAVRAGAEEGRPYLAAALHDVHRGGTEREGRVWLEDGVLTPALAQALAGYLLSGEQSLMVDTGPTLDPALRLSTLEPELPLSPAAPRSGSRMLGWTAVGTGVATVVLLGITVTQANRANQAYRDARSMLGEGGQHLKGSYTLAQYNDALRRGDRARSTAIGTGVGAGAALVATVVMGYVSYRRTGEVGPIRF